MARILFNRLKIVLAECNKKGDWLAEQLGVTPQAVSKWVTNSTQPSLNRLYDIANILKVPYASLLVIPPKEVADDVDE